METVLLTGGAGFIGSHTAVELLKRGDRVVIADDLSNADRDVIRRIAAVTGKKPIFRKTDVTSRRALRRLLQDFRTDAVIHFAGYKAVGESVARPLAYYRNNLDSAVAVLECMAECGVHRFIFSSSATVYGEHNTPPFTEDMPTGGCTNPYAQTKYMIEQIIRDAAKADPSLHAVILRYFNPIGAHESGLIGEKPSGIPNNLMPYVTQVAAGVREKLSVFGSDYDTPDGTGVRDYIHVVDLARGHCCALDYSRENAGVSVFNLGTGRGVSVLDIVRTFEKVNGVPIPYAVTPRRPGDVAVSLADPSRAETLLHWKAEKTLEDMCRDAWRFQKGLEKTTE